MKKTILPIIGLLTLGISAPEEDALKSAFKAQSIELSAEEINKIRSDIDLAIEARCKFGPTGNNSKAKFAAVEIASKLNLNTKTDVSLADRITSAIKTLPCKEPDGKERPEAAQDLDWEKYYNETLSLNTNKDFIRLVGEKQFSPVKISWEDIGRYENSAWGDRISDVGIWVRKEEDKPETAALALSVRRDDNFRDKVLVVPADKIKIHLSNDGNTKEVTLPERLKQLGLSSKSRDKNVIVSNQFSIVPVPSREMKTARDKEHSPRSAFTFSIFPYGSTNFVITDVIEGSSDAIVGPGAHQLLFSNVKGQKAPFTASRAEDRSDLLKLESDLRAKGMDVDVQRYYLIQIPLKKDAKGIELSNMGTPPMMRYAAPSTSVAYLGDAFGGAPVMQGVQKKSFEGLNKVAIGHGETEGEYKSGKGYEGMRAEEPIRVTVVYFVTPIGEVTSKDMENFTKTFETWDSSAIWGGSFVTKS